MTSHLRLIHIVVSRLLHILPNAHIITIYDGFPAINDNGSLMKELTALTDHIDVIIAYIKSFDSRAVSLV